MSFITPQENDSRYAARNGIYVPPGEGDTRWVVGDTYTLKVGGPETNGALTLLEATVPAGAGAFPHIHHKHDEAFYLISGELEFLNGDESFTASAGSFFFVPRSTRHRFVNKSLHSAKMLFMYTPGGFEEILFYGMEKAQPGVTPPNRHDSIPVPPQELMERFATEMLPDAIPDEI